MRSRLSLLMFLQFAVPGTLLPLYSVHLQKLGFTPMEVGGCSSTQAAATVLSVLLAGHVVDRWLAAERFLAICAFLAGVDLWVFAELHSPVAVFVSTLVFWLLTGPALLVGTAICFVHLPHPERDYGPVRLWGTLGWMTTGWLIGYWFANPDWLCGCVGLLRPQQPSSVFPDAFRLGGLLAFALAGYALTLPHTPPQRDSGGSAPLAALRLLGGWPFAVFALCTLGVCVTFPFTTQGTPLLLKELGVSEAWLNPTLTLAQVTEVLSLAVLPMLLLRLGLRGTMLLGLAAWTTALSVLALGRPLELVVGSLGFNGLLISGFLVAGQVFVNRQARGGLRASLQALLTFVNALGQLVGNLLVGWLRRQTGDLPSVFAVGAAINVCLLLVFLVGFRPQDSGKGDVGSRP